MGATVLTGKCKTKKLIYLLKNSFIYSKNLFIFYKYVSKSHFETQNDYLTYLYFPSIPQAPT